MAHQDVTRTVKIEILYFMENNNAANVLHAKSSGAVALADLDDLAAVVQGWLTASWADVASTGWVANQIILTDLNSLTGPRKSYSLGAGIQGTDAAQPVPANATLAIKADVGRRGRGIAGRVFFIGLAESGVQGNEVLDTSAANIVAAYNELNTLVTAMSQFDGLCVPHMVVGGVKPNPASSDLITNFLTTNNLIDSQKDRLPFHKKRRIKKPTPTP